MHSKLSLSIIIPAHNEEDNIDKHIHNIIKFLKIKKIFAEIIIVDDNSTDRTGLVCELLSRKYKNVRVFHRKENPGMGGALKLGTHKAKSKFVVWLMGDISDDLKAIPKFIQELKSGKDMVIASRYMIGGNPGNLESKKRILGKAFSIISKVIFGLKVHDVTYAYRAFRKQVFYKCNLKENSFAISPEFTLKAHNKKFVLGEVPVYYKVRKRGVSKMRIISIGLSYGRVLFTAFFKELFKSIIS